MTYTVKEAANKLNISKATIYKRLELKEFKDKVITERGKIYIDDNLLILIRKSLRSCNNQINVDVDTIHSDDVKLNMDKNDIQTISNNQLTNKSVGKDLVITLINQLKEKDIQIQDLSNRLYDEQLLFKQLQDNLQNNSEKERLQLESHFEELDIKLLRIKDQMQERKATHENKGFFKKIFNK